MPSADASDGALLRCEFSFDTTSLAIAKASTGPSVAPFGHLAMGRFTEPGSQRWLDGTETGDCVSTLGLMVFLLSTNSGRLETNCTG